jgi:hypothetical protein
MRTIKIHLFQGRGLVAWAIRWFTWGKYSHVGIQMGNYFYEAREGSLIPYRRGEVKVHYLKTGWAYSKRQPAKTLHLELTDKEYVDMQRFLDRQVGKRYDYGAIFSFISRGKEWLISKDTYFCSELVCYALKYIKKPLFLDKECRKVSPSDIAYSLIFKENKG